MVSDNRKIDPLYAAVHALGDSWSWLIMRDVLFHDVNRFNHLQRRLGISRETLSARLERLVDNNVLARHDAASGQAVLYLPTQIGEDLFASIAVATRWGQEWCAPADASLISMIHETCGHEFLPEFRCRACAEPIDPRAVKATSDATTRSVIAGDRTRLVTGKNQLLDQFDPLAEALSIIADRWTSLIIRECFFGARRFDTFTSTLGIATNTLTKRLKHLVDNDVLNRTEYQQQPTRHEYRLTNKGLAVYPIPLALLTWGRKWFSANTAPIELIHRTCNNELEATLTCGACNRAADRAATISESTKLTSRQE
ncbi:MAG: helix-turn-helix domain-containing protein [Actinomycetota bacterium]